MSMPITLDIFRDPFLHSIVKMENTLKRALAMVPHTCFIRFKFSADI